MCNVYCDHIYSKTNGATRSTLEFNDNSYLYPNVLLVPYTLVTKSQALGAGGYWSFCEFNLVLSLTHDM